MTAEEAYDQVAEVLHREVTRFARARGGDPCELLSEAHVAFMRAWASHRPEKSPIGAWVTYRVRKALMEGLRERLRRRAILRETAADLWGVEDRRHWDMDEFLGGLSIDALDAVLTLFSLRSEGEGPHALRAAVWRELRFGGWAVARIEAAFAEVRDSLEGG